MPLQNLEVYTMSKETMEKLLNATKNSLSLVMKEIRILNSRINYLEDKYARLLEIDDIVITRRCTNHNGKSSRCIRLSGHQGHCEFKESKDQKTLFEVKK